MTVDDLKTALKGSDEFADIDMHFALFMGGLSEKEDISLIIASALVSKLTREGDICLDLEQYADQPLLKRDDGRDILCPPLKEWLEALKAADVVGKPGEFKPLIIDGGNRLYLYRYWNYESSLGKYIKNQAGFLEKDFDRQILNDSLDRLFPRLSKNEFDCQKLAAFTAMAKRLSIITGGPGTGKTSTVARVMALLLENDSSLKIALAAPTGKAAARLQEAIRATIADLNSPEHIKSLIPDGSSTIHRLLSVIPHSPYFKHDADNPLPYDVVVVDEASMVDLPLISKLVQALDFRTKLILIGDKDQLASVEAGAVLGDICSVLNSAAYSSDFKELFHNTTGDEFPAHTNDYLESPLRDAITELQKSYRFDKASGIGALSKAANSGDRDTATKILKEGKYRDIKWSPSPGKETIIDSLRDPVIDHYANYLNESDPKSALEKFAKFQVLCAVREGPFGVESINYYIEEILRRVNLIAPGTLWYHGRPILITKNDYRINLYNGDIGIILKDPETGDELKAYFIMADGGLRKLSPLRLPAHETVYAMTVHKSQGSEFDNVLFILPDRESPVVTRELIYTAITRARKHIEIWSSCEVFNNGIGKKIYRTSGLGDILKG